MPLILVVEQDEGVLERVLDALGPEGWRVVGARDVTDAMGRVASEAPDLFLVSMAVERAQDILGPFARLRGGPGTLALIPEGSPRPVSGAGFGADAVLSEPFAETELRDAVARILRGADRRSSQQPGSDEPKLTSADIFGELVAEVEKEARDEASSRSRVKWGSPPKPTGQAGSAEPRRPSRGAASDDDEIERKLEQTLSGVLGASRKPAASSEPPPRPTPPAPPKAPAEKRSEVDELISKTLSGLDLGGAARRKSPEPPAPGPPPRPEPPARATASTRADEPFDLPELEELIRVHKAPARRKEPLSDLASKPEGPEGAPPGESPAAPPVETGPTASEPPPAAAEPVPEATAQPAPEPPIPEAPAAEAAAPEPAAVAAPAAPASEPAPEPVEPPVPAAAAAEEPKTAHKDSAPGVEFGQYRLLERIGVGGMAEVWKARMTGVEGFQKTVAIKKILPHLTDSPAFVDMFIDEAKLAAQLSHANIIHIYDLGKIGDDYYIAMEYVEGENLRNLLNVARERGKPMPVGLSLYVAARLASALDHAHHKRDFEDRDLGLVHRDVSPQNVLIGYEGTIKLCDFGIVKAVAKSSHTQMGALKGKLQYMSPEQAWGKTVDGRSDIFAVGSLLFEMLAGRRLFAGDSEMEVLEAVRECRVGKPSELRSEVSEEVDAVVLKALEAEPADRFQSAGELSRRLEELVSAFRPAPGQGELAAYVAELFDRGSAATGREPADELPPRVATGTAAPGRAAATAVEAEAGTGAAAPGSEGGDDAPVQAVEPVSEVEPEEGGHRGKGLLVAAIVVALLAGALLVWYLMRPKSGAEIVPQPEVPAQTPGQTGPPAAPEGAQAPSPVPETAQGAAPGPKQGSTQPQGPAPGQQAATGAEGAGPAGAQGAQEGPTPAVAAAVDQALKQRMARREKELRGQFEAEERRLKNQLDQVQNQKPKPAAAEASPSGEKAPAAGASQKAAGPGPAKAAPPKPAGAAPSPAASGGGSEPGAEASAPAPAQGSQGASAGSVPSGGSPPAGGEAKAAPATQAAPSRPAPKPEPPPAPSKPSVKEGELVTEGPGVVRPQVVSLVKPEYPPMARSLRVEGDVVVSVLVDETGRVVDTRLDKRVPQHVGLNEAALEAARKARFRPATKNGVRVKMWTTLSFPFRL